MKPAAPARILVVTDRVGTTPELLDAIRARADRSPAEFQMLVPNPARVECHPMHPERHAKVADAELALTIVLPLIAAAAGHAVHGTVSIRHDVMDAVEECLQDEPFDEILLAVASHGVERRLHIDLPHRLAHLGLPVTTVAAPGAAVAA
jgi:hypothetical protein